MWLTDNVSGHYKRATMIGVTIAFANTSGIIIGQIFTQQSKPRYLKGLAVTLCRQRISLQIVDCIGLITASLTSVITLAFGMRRVNQKRDRLLEKAKEEGSLIPDQPEKGDYNPYFRYSL
jgi:hypothetical protein